MPLQPNECFCRFFPFSFAFIFIFTMCASLGGDTDVSLNNHGCHKTNVYLRRRLSRWFFLSPFIICKVTFKTLPYLCYQSTIMVRTDSSEQVQLDCSADCPPSVLNHEFWSNVSHLICGPEMGKEQKWRSTRKPQKKYSIKSTHGCSRKISLFLTFGFTSALQLPSSARPTKQHRQECSTD